MRLISKKEVYILSIMAVYMLHSLAFEYFGKIGSVEWVASFYLLDYLIVALLSFLIDVKSKLCRIGVNTMGIYKIVCAYFIVVAYFNSETVAEFWVITDNIAPFYLVILLSIVLSLLTEYINKRS